MEADNSDESLMTERCKRGSGGHPDPKTSKKK